MVGPDDHRIYRQLQSGLAASQVEWVDMRQEGELRIELLVLSDRYVFAQV
jgi:hypothetical protein